MTDSPGERLQPGSGEGNAPTGGRDSRAVDFPRGPSGAVSGSALSGGGTTASAAANGRPVDETAVFRAPASTGTPPPVRAPSGASLPAATVATRAPGPAQLQARGRRRATLSVASIDPWSVFRFTLVFSVTLLIVWIVVAAVLWSLLNGMHVFDSLTNLFNILLPGTKDHTVDELFNFKKLMVWAAGLGVLNAILFTALGTLGAFIYNLCARIVGGFEVTLSDRG